MKRTICLMLMAVLILSGCSFGSKQDDHAVTFYYLHQYRDQDSYDRFFFDGAIGTETWEVPIRREDLNYLLALYMQGPNDDQFRSPFPAGSKILETRTEDGHLTIVMNAIASQSNEMDVTVSCACIARTCMELVDVDAVTVKALGPGGQELFSRTFTNDTLILVDTHPMPTESGSDSE